MTDTTQFLPHRCPACGASLLGKGGRVWCSFVGGRDSAGREQRACDYGIWRVRTLEEAIRERAGQIRGEL